MFKHEVREIALEKHKEVIALDPDGNAGTTEFMDPQVSCSDYAEFSFGLFALKARQPNPDPMLVFVRKHSSNALTESACENISHLYYEDESSKHRNAVFCQLTTSTGW